VVVVTLLQKRNVYRITKDVIPIFLGSTTHARSVLSSADYDVRKYNDNNSGLEGKGNLIYD